MPHANKKDTTTVMNIVKRLYDWMLSWGNSRWGALALFCFAFAESSFFPIPPDVLLIALCLGIPPVRCAMPQYVWPDRFSAP